MNTRRSVLPFLKPEFQEDPSKEIDPFPESGPYWSSYWESCWDSPSAPEGGLAFWWVLDKLSVALLSRPCWILPQLDSAPPSGFQVQPPVLERHPTQQVSCEQPQGNLSLAWKKNWPLQNSVQGSRCLLAVGLKGGEGRMVEQYSWLWKASCYFQTYYAR